MANKHETLTELFTSVAEKIRKKTGTAAAIVADNFPEALETILTPADGSIPTKTASDMTVSGATVTVPAGYYETPTSKSVNTTEQATPSISVDTAGLITASAEQAEGYVSEGNKSNAKQLPTQAGKTVTPSTNEQTAVDSGVYTTGEVKVAGDANLKAENIAEGVSIFGVEGTHSGGIAETVIMVSTTDGDLFNVFDPRSLRWVNLAQSGISLILTNLLIIRNKVAMMTAPTIKATLSEPLYGMEDYKEIGLEIAEYDIEQYGTAIVNLKSSQYGDIIDPTNIESIIVYGEPD